MEHMTQDTATHTCDVPEREGYHVIAACRMSAIQIRLSTTQLMSCLMATTLNCRVIKAGQIIPTMNLKEGDAVYTRVFDGTGENPALSTHVEIANSEDGQPKNWSKALATKVNEENNNIKSGVWSENGFAPIYGMNPIYVNKDGDILCRNRLRC